MKNKSNKNSLIYAGAVLILFILLIHLTLSRPDGGFISAVGMLIFSLFQLVVFVIGLVIGIAVCIAVMLCIFIASAYLVDSGLGKNVAQRTKEAALTQLKWMLATIMPGKFGGPQGVAVYAGGEPVALVQSTPIVVNATRKAPACQDDPVNDQTVPPKATEQVTEVLRKMEERLSAIESSIQFIESNSAQFVRTEQFEALGAAVQAADARSHEILNTRISPLQEQLTQIGKQNEEFGAASKKLDDIALRIDSLEQKTANLTELPQQVSGLRDEFTSKYEAIPQRLTDLRGEVQQQIDALKPKPAAKGRPRKKAPAQKN